MDKRDYVIIWLSLQLVINGFLWMRAEKRVSYYAGQHDLFQWASDAANEPCGPYEQPVKQSGKRAK